MGYDYDKLYGETRDALGAPTQVFIDFFDSFATKGARILDVGCGQGRDALFIARLGHRVTGVDLSPNGIRDLVAVAAREGLDVEGVVADITRYEPEGMFDVVLIDRTLHMLNETSRHRVLAMLLDCVVARGWVLIADEPANIRGLEKVVDQHNTRWDKTLIKRGYLFVRRREAT